MSDKKISELTALTAPDGTEELVVNDSGTSKKITQANLFKLGDNVKAKFGASDDLQIYHNGSASYIKDAGLGNLRIVAGDLRIVATNDSTNLIAGISDDVYLYSGGVEKLATTATGINVIGSVTCDDLNVDGSYSDLKLKTSSGRLDLWLTDVDTTEGSTRIRADAGDLLFITGLNERARVTDDGITFNGDTAAANALDDYEEGDWDSEVGGTATYGVNQARYTKIGRQVIATFDLNITTIGTGSTTVVTGLPFAVGDSIAEGVSVSFFDGLATSVVFLTAYAINSEIRFRALTAAGTGLTDASVLGSGCRVTGTVSYTV
ncbi:MAG: hypothetical protein HOF36_05395 [Candidatus Marinimicrobia bacterium]|nr:hypothetical protein [Candidatus Neomarinimicrobiota bacterium]